jgi:hypothetical protein
MPYTPDDIIIFLGPTLPLHEAQSALNARYLPPAKQGDILTVATSLKPKVIGLIDGFFMQALSVWHKEILYALDQGIILLGASSMGALRAAETARYGMHGVGKIFDLYHKGEVIDDDEVVLIHAPAEEGYLPLSIPLINVRFTLEIARQHNRFPEELCAQFFSLFQTLYFADRTWSRVEKKALEAGINQETVTEMLTFLRMEMVDQKKKDALLLLETIKTLTPSDAPPKQSGEQTPLFDVLYHYDRRISLPPEEISSRQIAQYVAVHHPDFNTVQFHGLNQILADLLAKILNIIPSVEAIEEEKKRFFMGHHLEGEEQQAQWIERNRLKLEEFEELMSKRAAVRILHRSLVLSHVPYRQTKALLEELKLNNCYEEWETKALSREQLLKQAAPCFAEMKHPELGGIDLIKTHLKESLWNPDLPHDKWLIEAGFSNEAELKIEILKSKIAEAQLHQLLFF